MSKGGSRQGAGRKALDGKAIQFRLPDEQIEYIKQQAKKAGVSQSKMLQEIISVYQDI